MRESNPSDRPAEPTTHHRPSHYRGHGDGSVWFREDRNRWVAEIELPDGRTKTQQFRSRKQAENAIETLKATASSRIDPNTKLGDFLRLWVERTEDNRGVKTHTGYLGIIKNHLAHTNDAGRYDEPLARIKTGEVRARDIDAYMTRKQLPPPGPGLSAQTMDHHRELLRLAYSDAARWDTVPMGHNPAALSKPPKIVENPRTGMTLAQWRRIIDDPNPDRLHALWCLAPASGMREAELLGQAWSDISPLISTNPDEATIHLKFQIAREHGEWGRKQLKTGKVRDVEIEPHALAALKVHWAQQCAEKAAAGEAQSEDSLIFVDESGNPFYAGPLLKQWSAMLDRLGIPTMGLHAGGRYTFNTQMQDHNVDWRVSADLAGHSTAAMSRQYARTSPEKRRDAVNTIGAALDEIKSDRFPDQSGDVEPQ